MQHWWTIVQPKENAINKIYNRPRFPTYHNFSRRFKIVLRRNLINLTFSVINDVLFFFLSNTANLLLQKLNVVIFDGGIMILHDLFC